MPIYNSRDKLQLSASIDISAYAVSSAKFNYIKPSGTTGSFSATVNTNSDTITYDLASTSDIDTSGRWRFWLEITDTSGLSTRAETTPVEVRDNDT